MNSTIARFSVRLPGTTTRADNAFSKIVEKYTGKPTDKDYYDVEMTHEGKNFLDVFLFFQIAGELTQKYNDAEISVDVASCFGSSNIWILPDEGNIQCFLNIDTDKVNDFKKDKLRDIKKIIDGLCNE
jgi:hypothetical protein